MEQLNASEEKRAWNWAIRWLSRSSLHSQTLAQKMHKKGFSTPAIEKVLVRLAQSGFLDDAAYTTRFVQKLLESGKSALQIYAKAKAASLPLTEVRAVLGSEEAQNLRTPTLQRLIERKYPILLQNAPPAAKRKALAALLRRGFSYASIERVLQNPENAVF